MKSCILTVIKNEHLYLNEWIRYHLNLGVDSIFIFEDIDSESHKEIVDKYRDKVFLNNISSILNKRDIEKAHKRKNLKYKSAQLLYVEAALLYLQKTQLYDWCFVIDADEFITLENSEDTLNDILSLYNEFDALILSWQCYGANGLIHKPDYSTKGVIDVFTTPMSQDVLQYCVSAPMNNKKTCYRLSEFDKDYFNSIHVPKNNCNYCNTDFVKDNIIMSYKNIYIRHYLTKSWEEYVWKKKTRGYFMGFARSFDAFFKMNPDMIGLKEELVSKLDEEVLVVLPYAQRGAQGNELRIALKGWEKYCQFKYHFVVIGDFDNSLLAEFPWVEFIYIERVSEREGQYNPHLDVFNKLLKIYEKYHNEYKGFIRMMDDFYAIKPFDFKDVSTICYHSSTFTGDEKAPTYFWSHDLWKTRQLLDKENLPHINYTTHYPCYFEFARLFDVLTKYNMLEESYEFDTIYFNSYIHDPPILDSTIRLGIWNKDIYKREFDKAINNPNIKFVCNSVGGWSKELEESLKKVVGMNQDEDSTNSGNG